jgi:hypothetical protein
MTPEAVEERRAEIARLAEAWVRAEGEYQADDASDTERCAKLCLDSIEAEAAFTAELSRLQAALAAREGYVLVPKVDMDALCDEAESNFEHGRDAAVGDCAVCQAIIRYRSARPTPADSGEG